MPYKNLSAIYDYMMSYVPYQNWLELINYVKAEKFDKEQLSIFELGGGTGTLGSILKFVGYDYLGSDITPGMCDSAWDKGLDFICCDCRSIPVQKKFDLVIFLFDGINYLSTLQEYTQTCQEVARVLEPGGYFLFDITTIYNSQMNFNEYVESDSYDMGAYIRTSVYDADTRTQHNSFDIFIRDDTNDDQRYIRLEEEHSQHLFEVDEIKSAIPTDLFTIEGVWNEFDPEPVKYTAERVHFLLKRK